MEWVPSVFFSIVKVSIPYFFFFCHAVSVLERGDEMEIVEFWHLPGNRSLGNIHECMGKFFHSPELRMLLKRMSVAFRFPTCFPFDRDA